MEQPAITPARIIRISPADITDENDLLAVEEPLQIQLLFGPGEQRTRQNISVTMRTPGHDLELATGFLFTEGIITGKEDILRVEQDSFNGSSLLISLHEKVEPGLGKTERNFLANSSCGVCGKSSIDNIRTESVYKEVSDSISLDAAFFYSMHGKLRQEQAVFDSTGGMHASALFDEQGNFLLVREDVGRHNALDKVIGACLLTGQLPLTNKILLLSGRASFELIQKANMAGIKVVTAVGGPSSLAVELAAESNITLVGFLRNERFNIYSGKQRINFHR